MALAHFAFGAAMTTLVVTLLVPTVWYPRTLVLVGGGWAMVPDFHWVSPVANAQLRQIHETSLLTDLFWFHRTWDRVDPTDSKLVAAGLVALLLVATAVAERRSYHAPAVVVDTVETYLETTD